MKKIKLTAVVVIRNEGPHLVPFFEHLRRFCKEILVIDQQSTDNSLQLALMFADSVFVSPNVGWNEMDKGFGVEKAKNDWVVVLDPDERFPHETIEYLPKVLKSAEEDGCQAISFSVKTFWDGIPIEYGSIEQNRLVRKGIKYTDRIHSNFLPKRTYYTTLPQYHLKSLKKHEERLAERQKLDYKNETQVTIKNRELTFIEEAKVQIKEGKEFWEKKRKGIFKQLKPKSYLRIKYDKTK